MPRGYRRDIGFMRRSVWDPWYQSMRKAVPLILQNNDLEFKKSENDRFYQQKKAELVMQSDKAKLDAATDIHLKKLDNLNELNQKYFEGALKSGSEEGQRAVLSGADIKDLPALPAVPDDTSLTTPEILWQSSEGDINKFIELSNRLKTNRDPKVSVWRLPNNEIVRSYDNGKTYIGKDGKTKLMPTEGAFKFSGSYTGTEIEALKGRGKAEQTAIPGKEKGPTIEEAAREGTGFWANMGAAFDAVAGGLGFDALIGKEGFFQDKQEARQMLRIVRQLGKSAFMNSSRGAIWEQQKINEIFPDPSRVFTNSVTEANKVKSLRVALVTEREFNNQAIASSTDPKEIKRLERSNQDINKLLSHFGEPEESSVLSDEDEALINKYLE